MPLLLFWLVLVGSRLINVASVAGSIGVNDPEGVLLLSTNNTDGILRRQATCAATALLCGVSTPVSPTIPMTTPATTPHATTPIVAQTTTSSSSVPSNPLNQTVINSVVVPNVTGNLTGTANGTNSVSQSAFVTYNMTTVTDGQGSQVLTLDTYTTSSPTSTSQPSAGSAAPLVVQQVPPTSTDTPDVQMQYQPSGAWGTTGTSASSDSGDGSNGTSLATRPISLCNNGTKISNVVGSMIKIQFIGVEASLQMIPSSQGASYEVKFDDEAPITLDNYKADATTCEISMPWTRNGLENIPHNVTVTIMGAAAGVVGDLGQLEYNGLVFKGPQVTATQTSSGTNKWIIVGVSIGGFLILVLLGVLIFLWFRKRRLRQTAGHPVTQEVAPSHSRQTSQPMMSPMTGVYAPSHMRGDSNISSPPSLPSSPQMSWRGSYMQGQGQPHAGVQSMLERPTSWHEGGFPVGAAYPSYPTAQPAASTPYAIPVTYAASGSGTPPHSFVQGHARGPSNLSDNRNPFE